VNYEDRTDLLPPEALVGAEVLERLRASEADPVGRLGEVVEPQVGNQLALAVIARFIAAETADGAPEAALLAERDAAESGYVFGELMLGTTSARDRDSEHISTTLNQMDLLALVSLIDEATPAFSRELAADLAQRVEQIPDAERFKGALEEAMPLAWSVGLGVAVILADQQR